MTSYVVAAASTQPPRSLRAAAAAAAAAAAVVEMRGRSHSQRQVDECCRASIVSGVLTRAGRYRPATRRPRVPPTYYNRSFCGRSWHEGLTHPALHVNNALTALLQSGVCSLSAVCFVYDTAVFVPKRDVKLRPINLLPAAGNTDVNIDVKTLMYITHHNDGHELTE